jgi:type II secretory pathway pseudopilin PulG
MTGLKDLSRVRGFTLLEALVVLTVMMIAMLLGFPALQNMIQRSKTEGFVRETGVLLRLARAESIKHSVPVSVALDTTPGEEKVFAFRDLDADGVLDVGEEKVQGEGFTMPTRTVFGAPGPPVTPVAAAVTDLPNNAATFASDGSVRLSASTNSIWISDERGNVVELRIGPSSTARVETFKYDKDSGTYVSGLKEWE